MTALVRTFATLSMLLLVALVVAGCGGSGESGESDAADTTPTSSDAPGDDAAEADSEGSYEGEPPPLVQAWVDAIESCATMNVDASYKGCLDRRSLIEFEPALADAPGTATIRPADDPTRSYELVVAFEDATFTRTHRSDGTVTQTCQPADVPVCSGGE